MQSKINKRWFVGLTLMSLFCRLTSIYKYTLWFEFVYYIYYMKSYCSAVHYWNYSFILYCITLFYCVCIMYTSKYISSSWWTFPPRHCVYSYILPSNIIPPPYISIFIPPSNKSVMSVDEFFHVCCYNKQSHF